MKDTMRASSDEAVESSASPYLASPSQPPQSLYGSLDFFSACLQNTLSEQHAERTIALRVRDSMAKLSSTIAYVRREGLVEVLQQLTTLAATAAVEAYEASRGAREERGAAALLMPYDAVCAEVLPPGPSPRRSATWDRAQRALRHADFTTAVFHRTLVPRTEVRARMNLGQPVEVQLSEQEALLWCSNRVAQPKPPDAETDDGHKARSGAHDGAAAAPDAPDKPLLQTLTEVSLREQELALRVLQGLCVNLYHQRRCVADGCLIYYATEVWQCCLQSCQARLQRRRSHVIDIMEQERQVPPTSTISRPSRHYHRRRTSSLADGTDESQAALLLPTFAAHRHASESTATRELSSTISSNLNAEVSGASFSAPPRTAAAASAMLSSSSYAQPHRVPTAAEANAVLAGPVALDDGQVAMVVALIDAVEAACHYNPPCLTRMVQTGGVRALLNLAYAPCVPVEIRVAVLDTTSVLLQEVAPFRRMVAAGGPGMHLVGRTTQQNGEEDAVLQTMVQQAITGAAGNGRGPPPFSMDRASASKLDSAVREWFSQHGLSHVVTAVMELRNTKNLPTTREEATRVRQRATQLRQKRVEALLQAIDGKRSLLD